ncbi:MAG: hypothetical protein HYZ54_02535 [Ignavibacteriae bacterium]|nr:hypothetical protein [Ignavibacteriota bacterium]
MLCFICSFDSSAQGFDWQYSSRLPSSSPVLFIGGGGSAILYGYHSADIYSLGEEYRCGDYKTGSETGFSGVISGEHWQTGVLSIWGEAGYRYSSVNFSSITDPEPFKRGGKEYSLTREFKMKSIFHSIEIIGGIKWRIAPTHIGILAGIRGDISLKSTVEQTESVVTPVEFISEPFSYAQVPLTSIRTFYIAPIIGLGYDMELGRGIYATPKIIVGLPIMSRSSKISWKSWDVSAGIVILIHL